MERRERETDALLLKPQRPAPETLRKKREKVSSTIKMMEMKEKDDQHTIYTATSHRYIDNGFHYSTSCSLDVLYCCFVYKPGSTAGRRSAPRGTESDWSVRRKREKREEVASTLRSSSSLSLHQELEIFFSYKTTKKWPPPVLR